VLPAVEIPSLTDRQTGRFHDKPASFLSRLLLGRIRASEIEAEVAAQLALLQRRGLTLSHVDTHKHLHMFPAVLRSVLAAARAAGICAVRNPFEPDWSRRATSATSLLRRIEVNLLHQFEPAFRRIVAEEGFLTTDGALGVLATGALDKEILHSLLGSAPAGTWELVTHPGYNDDDLARSHTRLRQSRETERLALLAVAKIEGLTLIDFSHVTEGGVESSTNSVIK
jgi:predicted glycoside hydrolase/deacetylase ChbG (UPF0249 family)